ncbi:hypothetical protein [Actinomadura sp. NPDC049753]|uniref:hypothetical protein n=1 Tax=Actinomadura sp. NPDC049753 TaxID=3154739 RepID=UPI0034336E40
MRRVDRVLALAFAALLPFTGCSLADTQPKIERSELIGVWKSHQGGLVDFRSDGTFTAQNIAFPGQCRTEKVTGVEYADPHRVSGNGTWVVGNHSDEPYGAVMEFHPKADRPMARSCTVWAPLVLDDHSTMHLMYDNADEPYRRG